MQKFLSYIFCTKISKTDTNELNIAFNGFLTELNIDGVFTFTFYYSTTGNKRGRPPENKPFLF